MRKSLFFPILVASSIISGSAFASAVVDCKFSLWDPASNLERDYSSTLKIENADSGFKATINLGDTDSPMIVDGLSADTSAVKDLKANEREVADLYAQAIPLKVDDVATIDSYLKQDSLLVLVFKDQAGKALGQSGVIITEIGALPIVCAK